MNDHSPDQIEGYRIEAELARGGMGVVYLAQQDFPERRVALKLLSTASRDDRHDARPGDRRLKNRVT